MPQLNELQKSIIIIRTRLEEGMSFRHMANEINVDKNTILLAKEKLRKLKLLEESDIVDILLILNVVCT
jgi:predicted transcriptional regulator